MIEIGKTLISDDVVEKQFVCDLNACKGACCVLGDSGAPLEEEETKILDEIYDKVKPYMTEQGIKAVEKQGKWIVDSDGDRVTPLVGGNKECAYTVFENGIALCGIEKAWKDGKVKWQKPISCHLYPVRISTYKKFEAVNYEKWKICKPACDCGEKLQVPVYKFVKTALIRKYGGEWYKQLEEAAKFMEEQGGRKKEDGR
ncbi:MAG TPA: DUF3109 family protein [Bacteroidia bacterium]|jgi:hypothetical protein|nr:DUF3109 family protein [Bacteroidia bacterium]